MTPERLGQIYWTLVLVCRYRYQRLMDCGARRAQPAYVDLNCVAVEAPANGPLKEASVNRLACLLRHWTWADEAKAQFEQELANGWEYDEDPLADHPFGAYYHWCALLCGFSEAALEHELLSASQLDALRPDLEACLPGLRACRQLLVVIPASLEEHPRIVDLLRDVEMLDRLRRIHYAFGEVLREAQSSRELELRIDER
jgi:hypothetical protein